MRRTTTVLLVVLLAASAVDARRPKDKAGKVSDGVFVDKKFTYKLVLSDDWKCKVGDNEDKYRLSLTQLSYEVPPQYMEVESYTKVPRIVVYVDTTSMSGPALVDSLLSDSYKSDQKKEIYKEFEIINEGSVGGGLTREKLIPRDRRPMDIAGEAGILWTGRVKYRNEIATGKVKYSKVTKTNIEETKRVYGGYAGAIIGVKKGNMIILLHSICEENYFESVLEESLRLANSLAWTK
jgi:hypothetical protein